VLTFNQKVSGFCSVSENLVTRNVKMQKTKTKKNPKKTKPTCRVVVVVMKWLSHTVCVEILTWLRPETVG
jgi:hypothetical protein